MSKVSNRKTGHKAPMIIPIAGKRPKSVIGFRARALLHSKKIEMSWGWRGDGVRVIEGFVSKPRRRRCGLFIFWPLVHAYICFPQIWAIIDVPRAGMYYWYQVRYVSDQGKGGPWTRGFIMVRGPDK